MLEKHQKELLRTNLFLSSYCKPKLLKYQGLKIKNKLPN